MEENNKVVQEPLVKEEQEKSKPVKSTNPLTVRLLDKDLLMEDFMAIEEAMNGKSFIKMITVLEKFITVDEYPEGVRKIPYKRMDDLLAGMQNGLFLGDKEVKN